jgi:hypothetical protein
MPAGIAEGASRHCGQCWALVAALAGGSHGAYVRASQPSHRQATGEVPCWVLFQWPPVRTRRASCPGNELSSDCYVGVLAGCRSWMPLWQVGHTISILRRILVLSRIHDGCGRPGLARSVSLETWCTCTWALLTQFALTGAEAGEQLATSAPIGDRGGSAVVEDRLAARGYPTRREAIAARDALLGDGDAATAEGWTMQRWLRYPS